MGNLHTESDIDSDNFIPVMPKNSKYAGQLMNVSSRRSIEIQSGEADIETPELGTSQITVNYFYHEGRFWRAVFPLDGVNEVYGQGFNFSKIKTKQGAHGPEIVFNKNGLPKRTIPYLNHLQARFTMKPTYTIDLFPMEDESDGDAAYRLDDFIYTAEAVGPAGISFNLKDGLSGNLMSAHRFLSTQEMVFERIVLGNEYVSETPPLPINDVQKRTLLIESLRRSHQAGMREPYYLFRVFGTNNCTSAPFRILDRVLDYTFLQRIGAMLYRLPLNPRFYLWVRGLDADPSIHKLVRSEFEDYINDKTTQQRKQDRARSRSHT